MEMGKKRKGDKKKNEANLVESLLRFVYATVIRCMSSERSTQDLGVVSCWYRTCGPWNSG